MKPLLYLVILIASCKSPDVEIPTKFLGVWSRVEDDNMLIDIAKVEDRCVLTQFYADNSWPNSPNEVFYEKETDRLRVPGSIPFSVKVIIDGGLEILVISTPSKVERYKRDYTRRGKWKN